MNSVFSEKFRNITVKTLLESCETSELRQYTDKRAILEIVFDPNKLDLGGEK